MIERKTFGEQLREARLSARLSQQKLADEAGITFVAVNRLENGRNTVRFDTLRKLEDALSCKFDVIQSEISGVGGTTDLESGRYNSLREKVKALGPDEVLQFPGPSAMVQRIRIAFRKDREINKNLPNVRISHKTKDGMICISPRALTMPWEGEELKIIKVSSIPIGTPSLKGIKKREYVELINRINSMGKGEIIMIEGGNVQEAMFLRSRIHTYKQQGRFKENIEIARRKETIYIAKEKE